MLKPLTLFVFAVFATISLHAELKLPAVVGDHMVLQQKQSDLIWGWDTPGTKVTVTFAGKNYSSTAAPDGKWTVSLAAQPANSTPQTMTITGTSKRELQDILVGEVWICSGQSNMGFALNQDWNGDLEAAASDLPGVRLITAPLVGTQDLQLDYKGGEASHWRAATPATALRFSAIGFLYGRYLHQILKVPVGVINNAWGGSSAEAWVRRSSLEADPRFKRLMDATVKQEALLQSEKGKADFEKAMADWKEAAAKAKAEKRDIPHQPDDWLKGNHRPGNIFAGVVYPTLGYTIKGVIWYQGEANAGQAYEYKSLFPYLIEQWRKEQAQGDFSFYWVQLADYNPEKPNPGESTWAELREAQTQTMALPNTGQAVVVDLGEGKDIHPRNKHDVTARLVRWALVKDYGMKFPYRSPEFKSMSIAGNKATITLDLFGSAMLRPFDVAEAKGFAVCGEDKKWHWAKGKIIGKDQVEVWSDEVTAPIAVRYAWADNPVFNLFSNEGLPVTPFRTDDFRMITQPK